MKKRIFLLTALVALGLCLSLGGCHWVGKTAGKAQAKIEESGKEMKSGYEEGYKEEKKDGKQV
jgi:hypothetical protein